MKIILQRGTNGKIVQLREAKLVFFFSFVFFSFVLAQIPIFNLAV